MPKKKGTSLAVISAPETVKKHVGAIHTSGDLSLLERKTSNALLLNAYPNLITKRTHRIPVPLLCAMLGYDSNDIDRLKDTLRKLASTAIEFNVMEDGKESWQVMSMLSYGEIRAGVCTYRYDEYLAERLYDPEIYATINLAVQRKFDSGYALTLYENCLRYKSVGSTGWWAIEKFRNIMGATTSMYDEFKYLKREVIVKPLDHVNKVSDIRLEAEYQKTGRRVTSIRFKVTESAQQSLLTHDFSDQHSEMRDHPTYKRLIEHGIGDRLALMWVMQDEQRVQSVIDYVEGKDKKNQVKGSTAGYIRKLIEDKADVGPSTYEQKREEASKEAETVASIQAREKRLAELETDYQSERSRLALKALTIEGRNAHAEAWFATEGGKGREGDYDLAKGDFKDVVNRANFNTYLRKAVHRPHTQAEFMTWLRESKKIDPAKLGLEG